MRGGDDWLGRATGDLIVAVGFYTRLPFPHGRPNAGGELARASWAAPVAGAIVGAVGTLAYALAHAGAGASPETRLAIMRDSRIGTFGACALILSIGLRWAALASLAGPMRAAAALIAAHAAARAMPPLLMLLIPPARPDGLSADAGLPPADSVAGAALLGFAALVLALGLAKGLIAAALLALGLAAMRWLALNKVGGQTGDVLGALEQVCEIIVLLAAARG